MGSWVEAGHQIHQTIIRNLELSAACPPDRGKGLGKDRSCLGDVDPIKIPNVGGSESSQVAEHVEGSVGEWVVHRSGCGSSVPHPTDACISSV